MIGDMIYAVTIVTVEAFLFWPDILSWPLLSAAAVGGRPSGGRCVAGKGEGGRSGFGPQPSALCRIPLQEGGMIISKRAEEEIRRKIRCSVQERV
jgi:hypothetical protein